MVDYCENCKEEITQENWDEGNISSCYICGDNYCEDCEGNTGDICTECGDWICFNCSLQCTVDEVIESEGQCESWGCEDHYEILEVNGESKYICKEHFEQYKKIFIEKGYIDE